MALIVKEPRRVTDDPTLATYTQQKVAVPTVNTDIERISVVDIAGRSAVKFYRHHTDGIVNSGKRCELKRDVWSHERALRGMYTQWSSYYLPSDIKAKLPFMNGDFSNGQNLYYCHIQQWAAATGVNGSVPPFTLTLSHRGIEVWDWVTNNDPYGPIVLAQWEPEYNTWVDVMTEVRWRANGMGDFRLWTNGILRVAQQFKPTVQKGSTQGCVWGEGMYWGAHEYPFDDGFTVYKQGYKLLQGYGDGWPQCVGGNRPMFRAQTTSRQVRT